MPKDMTVPRFLRGALSAAAMCAGVVKERNRPRRGGFPEHEPGKKTIVFEARGVPGAIIGVVLALLVLLLFVVAIALGIVTLTLFLWIVLAVTLVSTAIAAARHVAGSFNRSRGRKR
jgi:hypothetical protein